MKLHIHPFAIPNAKYLHFMKNIQITFILLLSSFTWISAQSSPQTPWRSSLYPENWKLGFKDDADRYLSDFSYAGYKKGESPIPNPPLTTYDVTKPPYSADPTGTQDSTLAIQTAITTASQAGGGIIFLPPGTYKIAPPQPESMSSLEIQSNNIIIRGAGVDKTFLFNNSYKMRDKKVIMVKPQNAPWWLWEGNENDSSKITQDLLGFETVIPIDNPALFSVGDSVSVRMDFTPEFIAELGMSKSWNPKNLRKKTALMFARRIQSIDTIQKTITLDVPVRFALKMAHQSRVVKLGGNVIQEVGIENLSIGMKQHPGDSAGVVDLGEESNQKQGTSAFDASQSFAIFFDSVENGWIQNVNSYKPTENSQNIHLLSNGIKILRSRFVTILNCHFKFPQYLGAGGNGYHYSLYGQECLIEKCSAEAGRHNYDFAYTYSSGNVILESLSTNGVLPSDFHMFLSISNLFDSMSMDGDFLESTFRPYGGNPQHGETSTQSVFWNTKGIRYAKNPLEFNGVKYERRDALVVSHQWKHGYVIGTSGPASAVDSTDFKEGIEKGDTLVPQSLYRDQLKRRIKSP